MDLLLIFDPNIHIADHYQLEQNLKKVLKLNPSKADSSIKNMKYFLPIDYKDLK